MPEYVITDWSGGLVDSLVADNPNQSVRLMDLSHDHGVLRTTPNHLNLSAADSDFVISGTENVLSCLERYEAPAWLDGELAGSTVWVGKIGGVIVFSVKTGEQVKWYPLAGTAAIAAIPAHGDYTDAETITAWPPPRRNSSPEMFAQVGRNLYMAPFEPTQYDRLLRWDGWAVLDKDAAYDSAEKSLTFSGFNPSDAGVRIGDQVYAWSNTQSAWLAEQGGVVAAVGTDSVTLSAAMGSDVPASMRACFVRCHMAGIPWFGTDSSGNARTLAQFIRRDETPLDTAMANGSYAYAFRLGNSLTGYFGNISTESVDVYVTNDARGQITLAFWIDEPAGALISALVDQDIDTLEIYRAFNGGWWRKVATVTGRENILTSATWTDTGYSAGSILSSDYELCGRPPAVRGIFAANARLWALGTWEVGNKLGCSSADRYEHWPERQYGADLSSDVPYAGAWFTLGDTRSDDIRAVVPEGSNFSVTGISSSNLLILTNTRAWRISGWDETDWVISPAFAVGCSRFGAALNWGGVIVFPSSDQLMGLPAGGIEPAEIGKAIWPYGFAERDVDHTAWQLTTWNRKLVIISLVDSVRRALMSHSDGTWSEIAGDWNVLNTAADGTAYAAGAGLGICGIYKGTGWSTGSYRSGRLALEESSDQIERYKGVKEIHIWLRRADATEEVTDQVKLDLYDDALTKYSNLQDVTLSVGQSLKHLVYYPKTDAMNPAIRIDIALPETQVRLVKVVWEAQKVRG